MDILSLPLAAHPSRMPGSDACSSAECHDAVSPLSRSLPFSPSTMVSLKPPSSTKRGGVPTANASIGVSPNDSLWAMLTMALAPLIRLTRSGEMSLGAIHSPTPRESACFRSIPSEPSSPPPTWARERPVPASIEIVSHVPFAYEALPTETTYSPSSGNGFSGSSEGSSGNSSVSTHGHSTPASIPYTSLAL